MTTTTIISKKSRILITVCLSLAIQAIIFVGTPPATTQAVEQYTGGSTPRVNIPYLQGIAFTPAIFWFGKVDPDNNYADVRVYYYDNTINVVVHIIDRRLHYDTTPSVQDLTQWDSVSLFLDVDGNYSATPGFNAYRFDAQMSWWEPRDDYEVNYRGNGIQWISYPMSAEVSIQLRGDAPNNNQDDKGWVVSFKIPFTSLGLYDPPPEGTLWGLGLAVHDRDDPNATSLPDTVWPEHMNPDVPASWGQMRFGIPIFKRPAAIPLDTTIIRHGLDGANVIDGHVGGHTMCGEDVDHWTEWGDANYAGYDQVNIQNQWDVSDWPCFSKYYVTFLLDAVPQGQTIISATLKMHLFGTAGGGILGEPPDSYIQLFIIGQDWEESTLTWNNAPLSRENISGTWVYPMQGPLVWPGEPYTWDISRAVAETYLEGHPLRLALYSADGERHTGKYFSSSDTGEWNAVSRPTLTIRWGNHCDTPGVQCTTIHLPLIIAH